MDETPHIQRSTHPTSTDATTHTTGAQPAHPPMKESMQEGVSPQPQASAWRTAYSWISNAASGLGGLLNRTAKPEIDYARLAPLANAKPEVVLQYINQLKDAKLSDKDMTRCLNKISAHAAANDEIGTAYKNAVALMEDPIWRNVAITNLDVKKEVPSIVLQGISAPKEAPNTLRSEFFAAAKQDNSNRKNAFAALALQHIGVGDKFDALKSEYLKLVPELKTDLQKNDALAPFQYTGLNKKQFNDYIDVVMTIKNNSIKADCLEAVVRYYPEDAKLMEYRQLIKDLRASSIRKSL